MTGNSFIFLFILILIAFQGNTQTLNDLQAKKKKTQEEIEYTNWLLNKTGKNSKASLNQLSLLNQQINLRNDLIKDYNNQLYMLQSSIEENEFVIEMLSEDLEKIKSSYANLIKQANRKRGDYNQLYFLLSSEDFNQAYKRLLYTRQMTRYREKQSVQIEALRGVLVKKSEQLVFQQKEKESVLLQQMQETSTLNNEKSKQSDYYKQLQKRQRELKQHLRYQQRVQSQLQKEIEKAIEEEARKAREKPKTEADIQLSANFEQNKGKFPWPTQNGVITDKFGEHYHPIMKNILVRNNGVDITTKPGEKARAIFTGVVSKVFSIPGGNNAVILRHGSYMSVYSNLKEVYVKPGEEVNLKQDIGLIYSDKNDNEKTILKFQIWKESVKLNPELWIRK